MVLIGVNLESFLEEVALEPGPGRDFIRERNRMAEAGKWAGMPGKWTDTFFY